MMLFALKLKMMLIAAGLAVPLMVSGVIPERLRPLDRPNDDTALVTLSGGAFRYRVAGDFSRDGKSADAPMLVAAVSQPLSIMRRQVTAGEYLRCVDNGGCPKLSHAALDLDRPVVGVSWRDADAYAKWLSNLTGERYRLPTDEEWAYAAGTRFNDDMVSIAGSSDPSARWLAHYEQDSRRQAPAERTSQPVGAFGVNEQGLLDMAGNVWEWTTTCFVRASLENDSYRVATVNCGVRVVEGVHRTYMTDFVRDPRTGGCAVGAPPANLGFRLVRDARSRVS